MAVMLDSPRQTCQLLIADRGYHRYGLEAALNEAGFHAATSPHEQRTLQELGLLEMDALLEVDVPHELASFFPEVFRLHAWRAMVCTHGRHHQPTLVLARKVGNDPATAQGSYQEVVAMLQSTQSKRTSFSGADTVTDLRLPVENRRSEPAADAGTVPSPLARRSRALAHDLNNLLTIIRGNCHMLLDVSGTAEPARQLIHEVLKAGEQAAHLTAQFDSAAATVPAEMKDLGEVICEAGGILQSALGGHVLTLRLDSAPCPVRLYPGEIERVLVNLAANARDVMASGGCLSVATTRLTADAPRPQACPRGPLVLIAVQDNGPGLDERAKAQLFQAKPSSKRDGKGLGLAIVQNIIQQHNGHVEARSEPGQGALFHIYLPIAETAAVERATLKPPGVSDGAETVLLVEDECMVRSIFRRILQESGYFVLEAANGAEALFLAEKFTYPIHLLVTDVVMPRMQGTELAEKLTPLHPETGVLFLSGFPDGAVPGQLARKLPFAFLQKPFKADTLLQKVRELLKKK